MGRYSCSTLTTMNVMIARYSTTQRSGHIDKTTKRDMLRRDSGGLDAPPMTVVAPNAVSSERYVPSAKSKTEKI